MGDGRWARDELTPGLSSVERTLVEGDGRGREGGTGKVVGGVCRGEKRDGAGGMAGFREGRKGNRGASLV